MPTFYVSLSVTRPASLDDLALMNLYLEAAQRSRCLAGEMTPAGMIVDAEPVFREMLETSLRELLKDHGAQLDSIRVRRI